MNNIKVNKLSDNLYHIYNVNSRKHYTFGKEEYNFLINNDKEFLNYLETIKFNQKEKNFKSMTNYKINLLRKTWKRNKISVFIEKSFLISFLISVILAVVLSFVSKNIKVINEINMWVVILMGLFSIIMHEIGHLVSCINRNVMVTELGINFKMFIPIPLMYTDATGIKYLEDDSLTMDCILSGIFVNSYIYCISFIVYCVTNNSLWYILMNINLSIILGNFLISLKLDGYYVFKYYMGSQIIDGKINALTSIKDKIIKIYLIIIQYLFIFVIWSNIIKGVWNWFLKK